jgi:two-component system sensor histidine kinase RegB
VPAGNPHRLGTEGSAATLHHSTGLDNMEQLIQLRWIAVVGQIATILAVNFGLKIPLPLAPMCGVLVFLVGFNLAGSFRRHIAADVSNTELFIALLVDVGTLTAQLYVSGGATNPFIFLYLLQVILGAVLLEAWSVWAMVLLTCACFVALSLFHEPLLIPARYEHALLLPYIAGLLVCFALDAALLVFFITRINRNLRARDARLADLRERAVAEDHIIRMGLLASGAAHELGTPLSTVSVILGDWRRMLLFADNAEMLEDLAEMQAQIQRCKDIVGGVLLSAGDARGESASETTIRTFLDQAIEEWRISRPASRLDYDYQVGSDMRIVSDSAIKQMIHNLLDNAFEASPGWVGFIAKRHHEALQLVVTDRGAGFAQALLDDVGKPYQTTKTRPGAGLGLFLVTNVARILRGSVAARNRPEGGAEVTVTLPLRGLTLPDGHGHVHGK